MIVCVSGDRLPRVHLQFHESRNMKNFNVGFRERGIYTAFFLNSDNFQSTFFETFFALFDDTAKSTFALYGNHNEFATCPNGKCENARAVFNPPGCFEGNPFVTFTISIGFPVFWQGPSYFCCYLGSEKLLLLVIWIM